MGEHFPASIEIGGKLTRLEFDELYDAACEQGVGVEWDALPGSADALLEHIERQAGILVLTDSEASWGIFQELEDFCHEHNLSYRRHSDAYAEYNGELVWWVPSMATPATTPATQEGEELVPISTLLEVLNRKEGPPLHEALANLIDAYNSPTIPSLEIVELTNERA